MTRSSSVAQAQGAALEPSAAQNRLADAARARQMLVECVPTLRIVARGVCRDPAHVEDLVQDVLERALRSIDTIDLDRNVRGWMVTILHNLHIDRCRQLARREPHVPVDEVPLGTPDPAEAPRWSLLTADDVRRAAAELPDELHATYVLFAFEGRSYVEIAAQLGIPKATVGTRVLRARAHLKKLLVARLGEGEA